MSIPSEPIGTKISQEIDYKAISHSHPSYRLSKLLPLSGTQTVTVSSAGSTQETLIEIPTKCFNLGESILYWRRTIAAQAAGTFSRSFEDTYGEIQQMQLYTRNGQYLMDLNNFQNYLQLSRKLQTPFESFQSYDQVDGLYKIDLAAAAGQRFDNTANNVNYLEPTYLAVSAVAATLQRHCMLKLSYLNNTIASMNKDLVFPEVLVLRIVWNGNKVGYKGTSPIDPTAGVVALTGNITLENIALFLAVEQNQQIIDSLREKINSGTFRILVPYVYSYKSNIAAAGSQSISIRLNRGHGLYCKKIIHGVYNNTEVDSNLAYDHNNVNQAKIKSYYSLLDNSRLQEIDVRSALDSTESAEDYLYLRKTLDKTALSTENMFSFNWFHLENFAGENPKDEKENSNLVSGISLASERKWDIYFTMTGTPTLNHYTYIHTMKELTVSHTLITMV